MGAGWRLAAHRPLSRRRSAALHGGAAKYQGAARIKDALSIELERIAPTPTSPARTSTQERSSELAEPQGAGPAPADPGPLGRAAGQVDHRLRGTALAGRRAGRPADAVVHRGHEGPLTEEDAPGGSSSWRTASART